ncbi:hypothetical protein D9M71_579760 [compost metagenome]
MGEHFQWSIADHSLDGRDNAAHLLHCHAAAGIAEGKGVDVEALDGLPGLGGIEGRVVTGCQVINQPDRGGGTQALGRGDRCRQVVPAMQ